MIITNIRSLRDPFILVEEDAYYAYGTGVTNNDWGNTIWACYKNVDGRLDGKWVQTEKLVYELPPHAEKNRWAPEVHKYKGSYYMFTTYYSSLTKHRGCTILKSDSPEGPFVEITDGHITPADRDAIDGTLCIDTHGQPWMVFVREWTCCENNIGRMSAAKLSDDLTHFVSEPIDLFSADAPSWSIHGVTDGCFMYRTKDGQLLMLWSNFCKDGYCVGISRSKNGEIDGEWTHDDKLLFSAETTGDCDGGHGMIFKDRDGQLYLCVHSPNDAEKYGPERTILLPVEEKDGTLITLPQMSPRL